MGFNWYTRANQGLFELPAPRTCPIGVDSLSDSIKRNPLFSGKLLARLASVETIPEPTLLRKSSHEYSDFTNEELLQASAKLLETNNIKDAWQIVHIFLSRVNN